MAEPGATPPPDGTHEVTRILQGLASAPPGERRPSSELLPLVYADLRRLAAARMARLAPGQTLQATELVHEAYLRVVGSTDPGWQGRAHFFGAAARAMRDIVANHLERKACLKRGGHARRIGEQSAANLTAEGPSDELLEVEEALQAFERIHPRRARIVTMAFYGGMSTEEIAEVLQVSTRTVEREWRFARAWLNGRLSAREEGA
ncbi:MAG TPA: ECF-type sigma factor [Planctomycetota bacterium]